MTRRAPKAAAFEVVRNGQKLCVAGLAGKPGILTAFLHVAARDNNQLDLELDVSALDSEANAMLTWTKRKVRIRDEVLIRIIESSAATRVKSRVQIPCAETKHETAWLRRTAKKYGYKLVRKKSG